VFDVGGVLVVPDPYVLGPLLEPYGGDVSFDVLVRAHYVGMHALDTRGAVHDDWSVYNDAYVRATGIPDDEVDEAAALLGMTRSPWLWRRPIPGAVDALRELAFRGVPIGVVSNASGQIEAMLRRFGICQVGAGAGVEVTVIVDSHLVGVAKPDPRIFGHALDVLGVEPARVAYVGDSVINDVAGATAAGMQPVLLDPYDLHVGAPFPRIHALADLLAD
jgi:putative hydrolase of the HAD superfamily